MITKIQISPKVGAFHVEVTMNSWELPGRKIYLNSRSLISEFYVDGKESLVLPKSQGDLYVYNLPKGHRYSFSYLVYIEPGSDWFYIEDDGFYLPFLGEDQPPSRRTEITLPNNLIALSNHQMERFQQKPGLLRFIFEGQQAPIFSIAPYLADRIFSGNFYFLKEDSNPELLDRFLRQSWDYMYKNYGDGNFKGSLDYVVLPDEHEAFVIDQTVFFPWSSQGSLRAFEEVVEFYLDLGWRGQGDEAILDGFRKFFLHEIALDIYSSRELDLFQAQQAPDLRRIEGRTLSELVARDLTLGSWRFLEEIRAFLGPDVFYPILKVIIKDSQEKPLSLQVLKESFSSLAWQEGVGDFLDSKIGSL